MKIPAIRPFLLIIALVLTTAANATAQSTATVTVTPDTVTEGEEDAIFTIELSPPNPTRAVTVYYGMTGSARLERDYFLSGDHGKVRFAPGQATATVTLRAIVDDFDPRENAVMVLLNAKRYRPGNPHSAEVIIRNAN